MQQGMGRCVLVLQSSDNIEKYKKVVLWRCLHIICLIKVRAGGHDPENYMEFQRFLELFMSLSGETLQQKGETSLKQYADLTDSEMATIRNILIEKK